MTEGQYWVRVARGIKKKDRGRGWEGWEGGGQRERGESGYKTMISNHPTK